MIVLNNWISLKSLSKILGFRPNYDTKEHQQIMANAKLNSDNQIAYAPQTKIHIIQK